MKREYSLQEFPKIFSQMAPAGFLISFTTNSLSHLIKTTRGKEKLLSLFQYMADVDVQVGDRESHRGAFEASSPRP